MTLMLLKRRNYNNHPQSLDVMAGPYDHDANIIEKRIITDSLFTIKCSPKEKISFVSGQYLSIVLPGRKPVPLSIASSEADLEIEFGIAAKGDNTQAIRALEVGSEIVLRGPFGKFKLDTQKKVCFIAAGTGITPFMSMLRTIRDVKKDVDAVLVYSLKKKKDILWDELLHIDGASITFTQEQVLGYRYGRIDIQFLQESVSDYLERTFFLCGAPEFLTAVIDMLLSLGVPKEQILREAW